MPVNILLTFIIGSVLAWILIKITKTPPHLQGLVIGCCSAGTYFSDRLSLFYGEFFESKFLLDQFLHGYVWPHSTGAVHVIKTEGS